MNILCIGDIFGEPGRKAVAQLLPGLVERHGLDFVLANADNAAGGKGVTDKIAEELFKSPIDVITAGNHVWEQTSIFPHLETHPILRPYNVLEQQPGKGFCVVPSKKGFDVAVIHLQGRVFMDHKGGRKMTSPFRAVEELLKKAQYQTKIVLVDVHAEATAEKKALGWFLDGQVSAVVGTHTHIQTADEEIFPRGTAYITDLGMTGPHHSVIGLDVETALKRFLSDGEYKKFKVAEEGVRLEGLLLDVDEDTGRAKSVKRVREFL